MKNCKVGDKVVVNELLDTQIYVVASIEGHTCKLEYLQGDGRMINGGYMDVSVLRKPTAKQLKGTNHE